MLATIAKKGPKPIEVDPLEPFMSKRRAVACPEVRTAGATGHLTVAYVQGYVDGKARALLKQIAARFGDVPLEAENRILEATEPELDRWLLQILTAPTVEAVFRTPARAAALKVAKKPARRTMSSSRKARTSG